MGFGSWTYNMDEVGVTMVTVAGLHDAVRLVDLQHGRGMVVTMVTVAGVHDAVRLVDLQHGRGRS